MTPQQKRAIIVMIESIQHQLDGVRSLVADVGGGELSPEPRKAPPSPSDAPYLSDAEEAELGGMLNLTPEERSNLIQSFMPTAAPAAEGTTDVSGSN